MRAVAVRRLALRVPPGHGAAARQRTEDALHLAAPDEARLVILRRLDLGRLPAGAGVEAWSARAAAQLAEQRSRAVHGGQPGAEAADAVWFRSIDEARRLLLLLLASGRPASAWFWRLAVPDWRGVPLSSWLGLWLRVVTDDPPGELALARAVIAAAEAGTLPAIAAALEASAASPGRRAGTAPGRSRPAAAAAPAPTTARALALIRRHAGTVAGAIVQAIAALPPGSPAGATLARWAMVAAAPELSGQAGPVDALADALTAHVAAGGDPTTIRRAPARDIVAAPADTAAQDAVRASPAAPSSSGRGGDAVPAFVPPSPAHAAGKLHDAPAPPPARPSRALPALLPDDSLELPSRGAGVLLALRALDRIGLGRRLGEDADAAASGFGRRLLRHIAARARLPPDDALFAVLEVQDVAQHDAALQAWRVGLDRWLRRRARTRLAELTGRHGWLLPVDATLLVRFPVASADLRLRRLALDVDPGWVPWLGLSVRYHFSDSPLA